MPDLGEMLAQELGKDVNTSAVVATTPPAAPIEEPKAENTYNLEDLETGKFIISDVPREERKRLIKEVYEKLPEDEQEAFDLGWRPKILFRGKAHDGSDKPFTDHKQFLEKVKGNAPVLNERLRHEVEEKKALEKELQALREEARKTQELLRLQAQRSLERDEQNLNTELEEARSMGEVDRALAAERKRSQLEREKLTLRQLEPQAAPTKQEVSAEIIAFGARNPWFQNDEVLRTYAMGYDTQLLGRYGNTLPEAARLKMVEDDVKLRFPEKFQTTRTPAAPMVESGRNAGSNPATQRKSVGGMTFEQLPDHEKSMVEAMVKMGKTTKSKFMEEYNSSSYSGNSRRRY